MSDGEGVYILFVLGNKLLRILFTFFQTQHAIYPYKKMVRPFWLAQKSIIAAIRMTGGELFLLGVSHQRKNINNRER